MVYQADVHQGAGLLEPVGEMDVLHAGTGIPGRMVVQQDDGCRIDQECVPQNGAAVDGCLGERSLGEHHLGDDGEAPCQEDGPYLFMVQLAHPVVDQAFRRGGGVDIRCHFFVCFGICGAMRAPPLDISAVDES